ncbi:succinylglutamate desuccinylase/aspartoacylase family protein [Burkholderia ambifaria]|uniref:succinylglutamate desuccinylase/aspartoacylase domain-containing protein n=1 Tax=Burkholderia ambifaria TaxID=152480 RepID=UPI0022A9AE5E|nr:succinylglutamate desuccinylase/aspartoacylase family protein [Burkholderia ambifaria]WAS58712.1 succinylglutamate desuccinylase/aspartoacylase family protein [Burkholderia ambifaria]
MTDIASTAGNDAARSRLEAEIAAFERFAASSTIGRARVERVERFGFVIHPPHANAAHEPRFDLLFIALTHGNEYAGLPVLNALCRYVEAGVLAPSVSIGFLLGNVDAARRGTRFVERDLNRTFGRAGRDTADDRRAREMEPVMRRARFCVDLHQTIEPSEAPFFVFNYHPTSLQLAHAIAPDTPVVTHWGRPFSSASAGGCTSDEFIQQGDGVALSIELGQKGFGLYQIAAGVRVCLDAITTVSAVVHGASLPPVDACANPIYTWAHIVPYPDGEVRLDAGLRNFQPIRAGDRLGTRDGTPLVAGTSGLLLFPKYRRSESEPKPAELYRLLRQPALSELGKGDCLMPQS